MKKEFPKRKMVQWIYWEQMIDQYFVHTREGSIRLSFHYQPILMSIRANTKASSCSLHTRNGISIFQFSQLNFKLWIYNFTVLPNVLKAQYSYHVTCRISLWNVYMNSIYGISYAVYIKNQSRQHSS